MGINTNQKLILVDVINSALRDVIETIDTLNETPDGYPGEVATLNDARKKLYSAGYSLARKAGVDPSPLAPRASEEFDRAWEEEVDFVKRFGRL